MRRKNYKSRLHNLIFISLLSILIMALTGCDKKEEYIEAIEVPKNQILVLSRYTNHASGYDDRGIFIYSDGGVYSFDFSMTIYSSKDNSKTYFVNKLEILKQYSDPIAVLDEYDVKTLYAMSMELDNNKSIDSYTENVAWDAGSNTLSFYNGKKLVTCRETGDFEGELPGEAVKKLLKFYDEEIPIYTLGSKYNQESKTYHLEDWVTL